MILLLGALILGVSACSPGNKPDDTSSADASGGDQASPEAQAEATVATAASTLGLDVLSMNACTMFPGEAVAKALNATLSDPSNTGKGSGGPDCTYGLLTNEGSGGTQLYFINLIDPDLFELSLGALVDAKPIEGLGDNAFMGTRISIILWTTEPRTAAMSLGSSAVCFSHARTAVSFSSLPSVATMRNTNSPGKGPSFL